MFCSRFRVTVIAFVVSIAMAPSSANALFMDARIGGIYTDSLLSSPVEGVRVDADGNVYGRQVQAGEFVVVDVVVENTEADLINILFASIIFQENESVFIGVQVPGTILEGPGGVGTGLSNAGAGNIKGGQPNMQGAAGDVWLQALAYAKFGGTEGTGPDTVRDIFRVTGATGDLIFEMGLVGGDAINGAATLTFSDAFVTATPVPEPNAALLMGLGLAGLAARNGSNPSASPRPKCSRPNRGEHASSSRPAPPIHSETPSAPAPLPKPTALT